MNNRDYRILIKLVDEIDLIGEMIKGYTLDTFLDDEKTKRAVSMTLINIGELVKNLTEDVKLLEHKIRVLIEKPL